MIRTEIKRPLKWGVHLTGVSTRWGSTVYLWTNNILSFCFPLGYFGNYLYLHMLINFQYFFTFINSLLARPLTSHRGSGAQLVYRVHTRDAYILQSGSGMSCFADFCLFSHYSGNDIMFCQAILQELWFLNFSAFFSGLETKELKPNLAKI